jgi:hypothetical protein
MALSNNQSPQIPDPYLGTVYGNILDMFDNPAYNLKMYMMPKAQWFSSRKAATGGTDSITQPNPRADAPTTTDPVSGTVAVSNGRLVVLAQTGVTGVTIDDLSLESAPHGTGGFFVNKVKFKIIQPGGANFLDQIIAADKFLKNEITQQPIFFIDITFKGYKSDPDDNDAGGELAKVLGPISYQCRLTKISVRLDNTGSVYDCEATIEETIAFRDSIYRLPTTMDSVGKTIRDHVTYFEKKLNDYYKGIATPDKYEKGPDEIKFDLSALVGSSGSTSGGMGEASLLIKDDTLNTSNSKEAEDVNRAWTNLENNTSEQEQQSAQTPPANTGKTDIIVEADKIVIKEGTSLDKYFFILLSMNQEFLNMITRKNKFSDPGDLSADKAKTFVSWMRMNAEVEELEWDKKRGAYRKRYTYKPTLYNTGRSDVALTIDEVDISGYEATATKKLQDLYAAGQLFKSYYYVFSGRNDQILNIDLSYDAGTTLLMPPKGGALGDVSITSAVALNSTVAADADASGKSLFNKAKEAGNKAKFGDLLNSIKDTVNSVNSVASAIGRTPEQLKTILNDTTGKAQKALVNSLDTKTINKVASAAVMSESSNTATSPNLGTTPSGAPYTPDKSAFVYAEDLVMSSDAIDTADLNAAGIDVDLRYEVIATSTVPNIAEAATYVTTNPGNTLFGYVYDQQNRNAFLNKVTMTIRGDPWYLGKAEGQTKVSPTSSPNAISYKSGDNNFILQIAAARPYDPDVADEDSPKNSGYWNMDGMSHSFSGVYSIKKVVNHFRNGIYTVEVEAAKNFAIPLSKIRRVRVEEKPRDLTKVPGYDPTAGVLVPPNTDVPTGGPTGDPNSTYLSGTAPPVTPGGARNFDEAKPALTQLKSFLEQQGLRVDENPNLGTEYTPGEHRGQGHAQGRAFDVNVSRGVNEWDNPTYRAKFDTIAAELRSKGWTVLWGPNDGHTDHLHVEHPPYKGR